ncbi:MAG: hypothetical protein HY089_12690, partial [Ignavibacteriales bacterium]|nr:hypothetical protein [Ignavibacteriales bacterium]
MTTKIFHRNCLFAMLLFFLCHVEGYAQIRGFTVYANGYLRMLIVDPQGRKVGYEPSSGNYFTEIPDVGIGAAGIGIIDSAGDAQEDSYEKNPIDAMINDAQDGRYQIIIFGQKPVFFDLNIISDHSGSTRANNIGDGGVIDSGMVFTFEFTYNFNNRGASVILKKVESRELRQDIVASYKLKELGGEKFFKELSKDLDKVEKELSKKDSAKAREKLQEWWKEIEEVRKEMIKEGEKDKDKEKEKFITEEAYNIL